MLRKEIPLVSFQTFFLLATKRKVNAFIFSKYKILFSSTHSNIEFSAKKNVPYIFHTI